ncbi:MAG: MBOAT family protein [Bacteroidia bacterium]|nr:MBOAT family protein [Bacteroidia bacterium]
MIFNSVTYLVFLIIAVLLYWRLPYRARLIMLFAASITFYAFWRIEFTSLMLISALNDYIVSQAIYKSNNQKIRKRLLMVSLFVNLGLLLVFKYLYFFADNANGLMDLLGIAYQIPYFEIILPLGISFYTFQTISYTIDVYRGFIKPERDFFLYGSYVMFFPQLVAGPILRASEVIYQLKQRPTFNVGFIAEGLKRILYGLFLKVVLADNIAPLVDQAYALDTAYISAIDVWTMAFLFGYQIYFDFSAYSHIAIGSAKLMGIQFPENFNFPYAATSAKDFWKRWHISLSSWIRDYLYLPLMGAKVQDRSVGGLGANLTDSAKKEPTQKNKNFALFATWAIMGFWHGAAWTFVVWGVYHSIFIYIERQLAPLRNKITGKYKNLLGWAFTLPIAMMSWIPFRANGLQDVGIMYAKVLNPMQYLHLGLRENIYLVTALMFLLSTISYLATTYIRIEVPTLKPVAFAANVVKYTIIFILVFTFLRPITQFIYFQF